MAFIWLGRWETWLEKYLNAKGGNVLADVEPSLRAVLPVAIGNEDRYLQGWNRYGALGSQAAVAGNFGTVMLRNPVGSNVIAVVESLIYISGASGNDQPILAWGARTTDLSTVVSLTFTRIDPRGNPQPTCILSAQAGAATGALFQQGSMPAGGSFQFVPTVNCEYQLLPGQMINVFANVANVAVTASWLWRERPMQQSELT